MPDFIKLLMWLPSSPDLNPLFEYRMLGVHWN